MVNTQNYTGALIRDYQSELIQVVLGVCGERQNERSYPNLTELPKLNVTYGWVTWRNVFAVLGVKHV